MVKTFITMRTMQLRLLISWLMLSVNAAFFGQDKPQITDLRLSFENNQLVIFYNLIGGEPSDAFRVWVEIADSAGLRIDARTLSGDVGYHISGGIDKKISWNLSEDNAYFDKEIFVEVKAELLSVAEPTKGKPYRKESGYGELFVKSVAIPGWGLTEMKRGKPFWIVGVTGYACLLGSFVYHQKALDTKFEYENSPDISIEKNDELYKKATSQHQVSKVLAYSFVALWITDKLILTVNKNKSGRKMRSNDSGINVTSDYDPLCQNQMFKICYKF